jgi:hypothetical protein
MQISISRGRPPSFNCYILCVCVCVPARHPIMLTLSRCFIPPYDKKFVHVTCRRRFSSLEKVCSTASTVSSYASCRLCLYIYMHVLFLALRRRQSSKSELRKVCGRNDARIDNKLYKRISWKPRFPNVASILHPLHTHTHTHTTEPSVKLPMFVSRLLKRTNRMTIRNPSVDRLHLPVHRHLLVLPTTKCAPPP